MVKKRILACMLLGCLLCQSVTFASSVESEVVAETETETEKITANDVHDSYLKAVKSAKQIKGQINGLFDGQILVDENDVKLDVDGNMAINTVLNREKFGLEVLADLEGSLNKTKGSVAFELYMTPDASGKTDTVPIYFGIDTVQKKDESKTTWSKIDVDTKLINELFDVTIAESETTSQGRQSTSKVLMSGVSSLKNMLSGTDFILEDEPTKVNDTECYVLTKSIDSKALLNIYETKILEHLTKEVVVPDNNGSSSSAAAASSSSASMGFAPESAVMPGMEAASSSAAAAAASSSSPSSSHVEKVVPEYDALIRKAIEPIVLDIKLYVNQSNYLPVKIQFDFNKTDWDKLSQVVTEFMEVASKDGGLAKIQLDVTKCEFEYEYKYDDVPEIIVPTEAVKNAKNIEAIKTTVETPTQESESATPVSEPSVTTNDGGQPTGAENDDAGSSSASAAASSASSAFVEKKAPKNVPETEISEVVRFGE